MEHLLKSLGDMAKDATGAAEEFVCIAEDAGKKIFNEKIAYNFFYILIVFFFLTIFSLINSGLLIDNFIKTNDINDIYKIIIPIFHLVVVIIFISYMIYVYYKKKTNCPGSKKIMILLNIFTKNVYIIYLIFFVNILFSIVNCGILLYVYIDESKEIDKKDNNKLIFSCIGIVIGIINFVILSIFSYKFWPAKLQVNYKKIY
jgi:hypothetical protein